MEEQGDQDGKHDYNSGSFQGLEGVGLGRQRSIWRLLRKSVNLEGI